MGNMFFGRARERKASMGGARRTIPSNKDCLERSHQFLPHMLQVRRRRNQGLCRSSHLMSG